MPSPPDQSPLADSPIRERCYRCFRPKQACFCHAIPSIANHTDVIILQHVGERFHAFNTARIVHQSLLNSQLHVCAPRQCPKIDLSGQGRAGLLYPGPDARLLSDVAPGEQPEQLVVVDGTWHQARTLVRDIPALNRLPRFGLAPSAPGRYRIRREPTPTSLSTLEATVAALRILEPDLEGLDQLLEAFDTMIAPQLAYTTPETRQPRHRVRGRGAANIPKAIVEDLDNVVVAYGESEPGIRGERRRDSLPVYWVAQRLGGGKSFRAFLRPTRAWDDRHLAHWELTAELFASALELDAFRREWERFLRPKDTLAVYCQSTARLLRHAEAEFAPCLTLKSIDLPGEKSPTLDDLLLARQITPPLPKHPGRAGRRLANAVALVRYLAAWDQG